MKPQFKPGDIVTLTVAVPKRSPRDTSRKIVLDAGRQFTVTAVGEYAGSPEYTLRDQNADEWANIPESALAVTDSRPRSLWE